MPRTIALSQSAAFLELAETNDGYYSAITCGANDSIRWQALPPDGSSDAWVNVALQGNAVIANSWSGWRLEIDAETGDEMSRSFTK